MRFCKTCTEKSDSQISLAGRTLLRTSVLSLLIAVFLAVGGRAADAQVLGGFIVGTETDSSGSAVPCVFKAQQSECNEVRTGTASESGFYALSAVPAGACAVPFSKAVFEHCHATGIALTINATARADAALFVGECGRLPVGKPLRALSGKITARRLYVQRPRIRPQLPASGSTSARAPDNMQMEI
jgi:hypothetical protein